VKGLALLLPLLLASCGKREAAPDLAVYTGQGFQLVNIESKSTRSIPSFIPAGSFSMASNGKFLVFASKDGKSGMEQIYRLDFEASQIRKLTCPRWSNDGQKLLMAFEVGGAITSASGDALQWIDRQMPKPFDEGQVSPESWWSDKEILCVCDMERSAIGKLFCLDFATGQVSSAASFLPIPESAFNDVLDVDVNTAIFWSSTPGAPNYSGALASCFKLGVRAQDCAYSTEARAALILS
jgi:hypothetical protein